MAHADTFIIRADIRDQFCIKDRIALGSFKRQRARVTNCMCQVSSRIMFGIGGPAQSLKFYIRHCSGEHQAEHREKILLISHRVVFSLDGVTIMQRKSCPVTYDLPDHIFRFPQMPCIQRDALIQTAHLIQHAHFIQPAHFIQLAAFSQPAVSFYCLLRQPVFLPKHGICREVLASSFPSLIPDLFFHSVKGQKSIFVQVINKYDSFRHPLRFYSLFRTGKNHVYICFCDHIASLLI